MNEQENKSRHVCKRTGTKKILFDVNGQEKPRWIDSCIADFVAKHNCYYDTTLGCCCGHGKYHKTLIIMRDGKMMDFFSRVEIPRIRRFYVRDNQDFYYIPEVEEHYGRKK